MRQSSRGSIDVYLLFLIKKGGPQLEATKKKIKEYKAVDVPYYSDSGKYMEAKYRIHNSEFWMEFYFELLRTFCSPRENILSIYTGSKCMLDARVII
jgi:hypothetical protein